MGVKIFILRINDIFLDMTSKKAQAIKGKNGYTGLH